MAGCSITVRIVFVFGVSVAVLCVVCLLCVIRFMGEWFVGLPLNEIRDFERRISLKNYQECFGESHGQRRARLEREGRWEDWYRARDRWKSEFNIPYHIAYVRASAMFLPLRADGTPPPVDVDRTIEEYYRGKSRWVKRNPLPEDAFEVAELNSDIPPEPEVFSDGDVDVGGGIESSGDDDVFGEAADGGGGQLMSKAMARTKSANLMQSLFWVGDNLAVAGVTAADAPSAMAWGLYQWARSTPNMKSQFWSRMIPSKMVLEQEARFSDKGQRVEELIERFKGHRSVEPASLK